MLECGPNAAMIGAENFQAALNFVADFLRREAKRDLEAASRTALGRFVRKAAAGVTAGGPAH